MEYSTKTPIKNKISRKNSILQHTSMIAEHKDSVTDSVTDLWLFKLQTINYPLIRTIYPVAVFWVFLSPT